MGGAIAQLTWRRHRDRVDGLVLAATAPHFAERRDERLSFLGLTGLAALARVTPSQARDRISDQVYLRRKTETWGPWAVAAARHDWRMVLEAGRALGNFSSTDWLDEIDVPTSVIVTMRDPVVPLRRQVRLFDRIPGAEAFRVDGEHDAVVANADRFVPTLVRAVDSVTARLTVGVMVGADLSRSWVGRSARVARLGAKVGGTYAGTAARKVFASTERRIELDERRRLTTAQQVADELGRMKGALMKLGQMASYLDEGLPEPLRLALAQLQSNAPPMSSNLVDSVITAELGAPPEQVFAEWDAEPIAAASIGRSIEP